MRSLSKFGVWCVLALTGCASLTPRTFNEAATVTYGTATGFTQANLTALQARKLPPDDSEQVQRELDNLKLGVDVARRLYKSDPNAGQQKLDAVDIGLKATKEYFCKRVPDEPLCKVQS